MVLGKVVNTATQSVNGLLECSPLCMPWGSVPDYVFENAVGNGKLAGFDCIWLFTVWFHQIIEQK